MTIYHTTANLHVGDGGSETEWEVAVSYDYHPEYYRSNRWEPFEPSHVTIDKVTARKLAYIDGRHVEVGEPIDLTAAYRDDEALIAEVLASHEGEIEACRANNRELQGAEASR